MVDSVRSTAEGVEASVIDGLGLRDAVDGALREARASGLPGLGGGPADAYRHLLIAGEIIRRYGPVVGPHLAAMHEFVNDLVDTQTQADQDMDDLNNAIAADAPEFRSWEELVQWARGKVVEAAQHNGDGQDGRGQWHQKQPANWRPDFTNVPITPIEKGGPEHGYNADEEQAEPIAPPDAAAADPLDQPAGSWTEEDVRAVLNSPAYLQPQHVDHERAQRLVRAWFEQRFGTRPARVDATGRMIPRAEAMTGASADGCPVEVRAHTRAGGKIEVRKHCRSSRRRPEHLAGLPGSR